MADVLLSAKDPLSDSIENDAISENNESSISEDLTPNTQKKPKTYEKRKLSNVESNNSQCDNLNVVSISSSSSDNTAVATSSPQNTSRYGRARKPKITEDFYNIEDIFGPYDRIPCSPVRNLKKKLTTKLEVSPNKSSEIINIDTEEIKANLNSVLSINIPEDTIEVSKVMKIVSNNSSEEFSPKSPPFSKPVKTYAKRDKRNSESIYESFGLPDYPSGENCPYLNGTSHSEDSDDEIIRDKKITKSTNKLKTENTSKDESIFETVRLFSDESFNSYSESEKNDEVKVKKTKLKSLSLKRTVNIPSNNRVKCNTSDNSTNSKTSNIKNVKDAFNENKSTAVVEIDDSLSSLEIKQELIDDYCNSEDMESLNKVNKTKPKKTILQKKSSVKKKLKPPKLQKVAEYIENIKIEPPESIKQEEPEIIDKHYQVIDDLNKMYVPKVGDLTWSRVGSFPFWPSIVTNEPNTDRHSRMINFGKRLTQFYHVHFFGDNGRRSWVLHSHIFPFQQRSDLEVMAQSVSKDAKPKEPRHLSAFIINPTKLVKWETAVTEAEILAQISPENRINKFFEMVSPKKKSKKRSLDDTSIDNIAKKIKLSNPKKHKKHIVTNLKIKEEIISEDEIKKEIKEEPIDYEKHIEMVETKISKSRPRVSKNKPRKSDIKNISESDKILDKKRKSIKSDIQDLKGTIASDDSFSESEKLDIPLKPEIRDTPSPLPVMSTFARHKKINLFKGISRDRVCQICGKNDKVFKCKGNCYGLYHIECDKKQKLKLLQQIDEKIDGEIKLNENAIKNPSNNIPVTVKNVNPLVNTEEIVTSENVANSVVNEILSNVLKKVLPEDNTEITSVQKAIDNQPSLSIADQIDLKMQEVMKNLISETKYTDSATDESSESDIEHDTKTVISESTQVQSVSQSELTEVSITHLDYDVNSVNTNSDNNSEIKSETSNKSNSKVTKKIIKHVTADGIFDVIEEENIEVEDHSNFKCTYCTTGIKPPCFVCGKDVSKTGDTKIHKCMTAQCGKYYHAECLNKDWPQTKWYISTKRNEIDNENLSCPYHNCHTCISDDPRGPLSRMTHEKLSKCIRCPTTYHASSYCIPAGTEILSTYQLFCPKHLLEEPDNDSTQLKNDNKDNKKENNHGNNKKQQKVKIMHHVNASWCFICSMGGSLICCEICPSSFHVECLKMSPPEGRYLCEECESGRLPLYDEIVWVKLGSYRWWPAQILFPVEIPENVKNIPHNKGEFVVKFFGSHDHYWVNRGRVFLFQEGDTGHASSKKSAVDGLFVKAIEEATKAHKKFIEERANRVADSRNSMKPPSYIKIKVNKPVGDVRSTDADTSNTTPCDCDPTWDQPCGPDSDCLNRILLTECNPMVCAAGSKCCNQSFQNRQYAPVEPFKTSGRGWGLRTLAPVKQGTFVIEYVGEVINEKEYRRRMIRKHEQKDENYYFLTIDKDRMIDAGPKGNVARFMNHSCSPNCETQKWTVNGDTRVGLFAITDIPQGAELTFNYNLECIGEEKKVCRCGAPNCSGFIGVKAKQDDLNKKKKRILKVKKKDKRKQSQNQESKIFEPINCFVCGEPNAVQQCDREACNKFYHLNCVNLEKLHEGKWFCPWHSCNVCTKRTTRCCYMCVNSYCPLHSEGNIRYDRVKGFVCSEHDKPDLDPNKIQDTSKVKKNLKQTKLSKGDKNETTEEGSNTIESKPFKSIADIDLEEILKFDVISRPPLKTTKKIIKKSNIKRKVTDGKLNYKKNPFFNLKKSIKVQKLANNSLSKPVESTNIKKSKIINGWYPKLSSKINSKINTLIRNKNNNLSKNNLSIKKRKSRLSLKKSNDSDDDLPLAKKIKTINTNEKNSTKPKTIVQNDFDNELEKSCFDVNKANVIKTEQKSIIPNSLDQTEEFTDREIEDSLRMLRSKSVSRIDSPLTKIVNKNNSVDDKNKLRCTSSIDFNSSVDSDSDFKDVSIIRGKSNLQNKKDKIKNVSSPETFIATITPTTKTGRPRGRPRKYFKTPTIKIEDTDLSEKNLPTISTNVISQESENKAQSVEKSLVNTKNLSDHQNINIAEENKADIKNNDSNIKNCEILESEIQDSKIEESKINKSVNEECSKTETSEMDICKIDDSVLENMKIENIDSTIEDSEIQDESNLESKIEYYNKEIKVEISEDENSKIEDSKFIESETENSKLEEKVFKVEDSEYEDWKTDDSQTEDSMNMDSSQNENVCSEVNLPEYSHLIEVDEFDAEAEIKKSVILKETLEVYCAASDSDSQEDTSKEKPEKKKFKKFNLSLKKIDTSVKETKENPSVIKKNKLLNPRPGVRKSLRNSIEPLDINISLDSTNITNSELEISTNINSSMERLEDTIENENKNKSATSSSRLSGNRKKYLKTRSSIRHKSDNEEINEINKTENYLDIKTEPEIDFKNDNDTKVSIRKTPKQKSTETEEIEPKNSDNKKLHPSKLLKHKSNNTKHDLRKSLRLKPEEIIIEDVKIKEDSHISNDKTNVKKDLRKSPRHKVEEDIKFKGLPSKFNQEMRKSSRNKIEGIIEGEQNLKPENDIILIEDDTKRELRKSVRIKTEDIQIDQSNKGNSQLDEISRIPTHYIDLTNDKNKTDSTPNLKVNNSENTEEETIKRKRGRPRKKLNNVNTEISIQTNSSNRSKKVKHSEEPKPNIEEVTELYKMKLNSDTILKNPYENHINEVKLTTNVPERHLRVMLRKSELESKAESKFLKMQNDIERDLPIRKRSKLRYEAQL